jgi:hypothetical protein
MTEPRQTHCPIWGTPATELSSDPSWGVFDSRRAGGRFKLCDVRPSQLRQLAPAQKAKLAIYITDQHRRGEEEPQITPELLTKLQQRSAPTVSEQIDRFFIALSRRGFAANSDFIPTFSGPHREDGEYLAAWTGCKDEREFAALFELIQGEGYVKTPKLMGHGFTLSVEGFRRMEELQSRAPDNRQAFVAMWFGKEMDEAWREGFAPGVRDAGYEALRIDGKEHNNKIDDEIVAEIKRSRFLIADFTCGGVTVDGKFEPNPRGGVYYEAGLAHGLGMEVIFTCRADRMEYAHFDTRQFAHIVWQEASDLRAALYNRIAATVKEAPGAPGRGNASIEPPKA